MSFEQQLISWRRELHQNPELSLQEVATTARIRDWLQSGGLTLLPYDLKTGLVAEVGSGRTSTRCPSRRRPVCLTARRIKG